ncbi:uncharacterized protein EI90DRAFT_3116161 [Cantharellus anzutake]|uniref:uncharacterized protein n=1 Tax=Cantharellus anzutake TaxID=1750568 RepID=UPI001907F005|nr:uncharacterized protein EI90DRAFT_3116161 [Cantharellus anzutake]KAF8342233.1 hypothetical protein EI90DRAFT_3116161 [Cantharellus anzutake]
MCLKCVKETDEDSDAVQPPLIDDVPSSSASQENPTSAHKCSSIQEHSRAGDLAPEAGESEDHRLEGFFETESGVNIQHAIEPLEDNESTGLTGA